MEFIIYFLVTNLTSCMVHWLFIVSAFPMSSRDFLLIAVAFQMFFVQRLVKMQHSKERTFRRVSH